MSFDPNFSANAYNPPLGLHEPFLQRAATNEAHDDGGAGLAAFLAMRLVDQFCAGDKELNTDAVKYQCNATKNFVADIRPQTDTTSLLSEIIVVADSALEARDRRLLFSPLLAFAYCLEQEVRLEEALDVLETALRLSDGRDADEEVAAYLQQGRVLRLSGSLHEALTSYQSGGDMARRLGDTHSELLSRIGCGIVSRIFGNLPESEKLLRATIADASALSDRDAEARACHDLAGTLHFAGRGAEAVPLAFKAYELYESPVQQARALGDTGTILKELGFYTAARNAFTLVLDSELPPEVLVGTELEFLELCSLVGDRLSFERWRQAIEKKRNLLLPETLVDYELKLGVGFSRFDEIQAGESHLANAVSLAEEYGMGERIFYAERQLEEVRQKNSQLDGLAPLDAYVDGPPPLRETAERLEYLVTSGQG